MKRYENAWEHFVYTDDFVGKEIANVELCGSHQDGYSKSIWMRVKMGHNFVPHQSYNVVVNGNVIASTLNFETAIKEYNENQP